MDTRTLTKPLIVALLLLTSCFAWAQDDNKIHVAANIPLTGDLAKYGTSIQRGSLIGLESLQNAVKERIAFDWQDNQGNNKEASSIVMSQLQHNPDIYISGLKPQTMTVADQLSKKGIPHFTWILDVKINNGTTNNLRTWVSFKLEAEAYLRALEGRKLNRVAMVYAQLPPAELEYKEILVPGFKKLGAKEISITPFTLDTTDFKTLALKIRASKPDLIVINGFIPHMVSIVRELRRLKAIHEGNTLASLDMLEAAKLLTPAELEGIIVAAPEYLTSEPGPAQETFSASYLQKFGEAPDYHAAFAHDMVLAIGAAAGKLEHKATSEKMLKTLREVSVEGVTGNIAFDSDGSSSTKINPAVYRSGQLELLKK